MEDLLQAMMGGAQSPQGGGEDPMGELMEGLLGGASGQQAGGDPLSELLGGILGGGAGIQATPGGQAPQGGGLMDILGAILGGGGASQLGGNPNLMPFTEALSEKLGISPQMASVLIGAAFSMLTGMMQKGAQGDRGLPADADMDNLLDEQFLTSSGAASQVARQTGLDEATAAHHLREAMVLLANPQSAAAETTQRPKTAKPSELDHLLDSWEGD